MSILSEIEAGLATAAHKGLHLIEAGSHALIEAVHSTVPPTQVQEVLKIGTSALLSVAAPVIATGEPIAAETVGNAVAGAVGGTFGPAIGTAVTQAVSVVLTADVAKVESDVANLGG
jgi:hypothetical protein